MYLLILKFLASQGNRLFELRRTALFLVQAWSSVLTGDLAAAQQPISNFCDDNVFVMSTRRTHLAARHTSRQIMIVSLLLKEFVEDVRVAQLGAQLYSEATSRQNVIKQDIVRTRDAMTRLTTQLRSAEMAAQDPAQHTLLLPIVLVLELISVNLEMV